MGTSTIFIHFEGRANAAKGEIIVSNQLCSKLMKGDEKQLGSLRALRFKKKNTQC